MPVASIFKSKPKSDRRVEWKNLKAKHAKTLKTKKLDVEIGLGKALDDYQKHVDRVVALPAEALNEAAFRPVVASAAKVKLLVDKLEPKVKGLDDFPKFLADLEKDCAWWDKAAKEIKSQPGNVVDIKEATRVDTILESLEKAKAPMKLMDGLLNGAASKETATYEPPKPVLKWAALSKALKPDLAKLSVLAKNKSGNHKLIVSLLRNMHEPVSDLSHNLVQLNRTNLHALHPVTDWTEVKETANDILLYVGSVETQLGKL